MNTPVKLLSATLLGLALSTGHALADSDGHKADYRKMMQERHAMMKDMLSMMKTTMGILRDLNHKPSAEQKRQLSEMMARMDEMMANSDRMHEMMQDMMHGKGKGMDGHH